MTSETWKATRRTFIQGAAALTTGAVTSPLVLRHALAQGMNLDAYQKAKVNWRQAEGQTVNVAVIAASYFQNLIDITPEFEALTGIKVNYDKVPPAQIRQKVVLDLSSKTGNISTHAADVSYLPLYAANRWCEPLDDYLADPSLTDKTWFAYDDILEAWRKADTVAGKIWGIPYEGEMTMQIYRKDLFDEKKLKPAETFDEVISNAKALHAPDKRLWGFCLRGMAGAGQNMYIFPSIFGAFGAKWFDESGKLKVNSPEAVAALAWYVDVMKDFAPKAAQNWNWPDIADAFSQGEIACYIDGHTGISVIANPERSKVAGKIGFARWPKGQSGRRVTSIWNWPFPVNAALPDKARRATWLFTQWACSTETQLRTSLTAKGAAKRYDVNRASIWDSAEYRKLLTDVSPNFYAASQDSLKFDTDPDWRPRVPQWPALGESMGKLLQAAVIGQMTPKQALDEGQRQFDRMNITR